MVGSERLHWLRHHSTNLLACKLAGLHPQPVRPRSQLVPILGHQQERGLRLIALAENGAVAPPLGTRTSRLNCFGIWANPPATQKRVVKRNLRIIPSPSNNGGPLQVFAGCSGVSRAARRMAISPAEAGFCSWSGDDAPEADSSHIPVSGWLCRDGGACFSLPWNS